MKEVKDHLMQPGGLSSESKGEFSISFNDRVISDKQPCPHCVVDDSLDPAGRPRYRKLNRWICPRTLTAFTDYDTGVVCIDCLEIALAKIKKEEEDSAV
jgi:hypothetical protein